MDDKRDHLRTPMVCQIKICHEQLGELLVKTRDISEGGVFVILDSDHNLPIGARVTGQIQGLLDDAPVVDMEVVRAEPEGVGLRFISE
ncbi:PilZ domain-containing protein [Gilvimarinus sp. SDUM040013]|uniref:PilZ domain-containing protein n=1 Tax=Gilvimarinus gilvus TaxID=3058038 RepID=A0ABU4S202_9GAMM|nr:PilZ domain-containing protein [Gilvimarinus sp. SDUM040013]MDO3387371.1 PilZ domain-containing protein [Gilvimarinus sp. SDUM040013]MDX6849848.1 PilZ domain-containing protein [Gilvimarinus sp. SDUM040013]